jgi:hypothetical protein
MCSFHFLKINVFTILRSEPESTKWSLFLTFFNQISICNFSLSIRLHTSEMPRLSHSSWFSHADNIWCGVEIMKIATVQSSSLSCYLILLRPIHFPRLPLLLHSQPIYLPHCERQICTPVYNNEQSYNSVYFNLYISGKQSDRQIILHIAGASNLLLISSWVEFSSVRIVPKYPNCSAFSKDLLSISILRFFVHGVLEI